MRWILVISGFLVAVSLFIFVIAPASKETPVTTTLEGLLGGASGAFQAVIHPEAFDFPKDHGSHDEFRIEWWYLTGNLRTESGREFGYQVTFFRKALDRSPPLKDSAWSTNQVFTAHVSLSDVQSQVFHTRERTSRGALGLSGAEGTPFRVWLEDWVLKAAPKDSFATVSVSDEGLGVELNLIQLKPLILQGDEGLSRKGSLEGQASYYYSITRLKTEGVIEVDGEQFKVKGLSWFDREWSSHVLSEDQVGWDWMAIQFEDQTELMLFRMRRRDGSTDFSSGGFFNKDSGTTPLTWEELNAQQTGTWTSERSHATYPSGWRLHSDSHEIDVVIEPKIMDQERVGSPTYWEGAVSVKGTKAGMAIKGEGYVELTGYTESTEGGSMR